MSIIQEFERRFTEPSEDLIRDIAELEGDIIILGAGGKIGPSIARLTKKALQLAGKTNKVIGVSRFSEAGFQESLNADGIETIAADILDDAQLQALPQATHPLYLAGTKFGSKDRHYHTSPMNAYLPGRVAQKFRNSRIVVYSTGNISPYLDGLSGGPSQDVMPNPVGQYGK